MNTKQLILAGTVGLSIPALAGTSTTVAPSPVQESTMICGWFIGGSFGRIYDAGTDINLNLNQDLGDLDFNMYTFQVGRSFGSPFYGFETSLYLEVAYLDGDVDFNDVVGPNLINRLNADVDVIPLTLNVMAERNLIGGLGVYMGGGIGYAWTEVDALNESETDGGFYGQLTAGLSYSFTETFEVFGGARWIYLDDLNLGNSGYELENAFAWETGLRFTF